MNACLRIFAPIIMAVFVLNSLSAQTTVVINPAVTPTVCYYYLPEEQWQYAYGSWNIGRLDGAQWEENSVYDVHRTQYFFDLSQIPSNATVGNAKLLIGYFEKVCGGCAARIVFLPYGLNSGNPQDVWEAVGNGDMYFDNISYGAVNIALSSQEFIDDIQNSLSHGHINIGALGLNENQNETHARLWETRLEVQYTIPGGPVFYDITVKNSFEGGEVIVDSDTVPSGSVFTWEENSEHSLEAFNQNWPAPNNYYRVFQNEWQKDGASYSSNNPILITVTEDAEYEAIFKKRLDFEVDNEFVDGGSGGSIKVNGQPQTVPYFQTLIEGDNIVVEAPTQPQTIYGTPVTYNFLIWSDGNTDNPRTFTPNDHTNVTAKYKAPLISLSATATAYNNSRKVAVDHIGGWHAVYEDNGQIYYLHSTNNGATWLPEELVSGRFGNVNRYPAITIEPISPFRVSVVWDMEISGTHYFNGRTKPLSGNWEDEFSSIESEFWWGISTPTKPAVLRRGDLYILTRSVGVLELYRFNGEELEWLGVIPGSDESSENPTMTASPYYPSGVLYFAWEQRNQVYFSYFLPPNTFGEAEEVTVPKADIEINRQPSISYSFAATNPINVAWSGFDTDGNAYVLLHRQRSSNLYGQWGSLNEVYYSYYNISHPSIGSFDSPFPGWMDVGLKFGNSSLRVIQYNGQSWRWVSGFLPGSHPSLNDQGASLMLVGIDNTTPLPYRVASQPFAPVQWEEDGSSGESHLALTPGKAIPAGENTLPAEIEKRFRKEIFQLSNLPGLTLRGKADISLGDVQIQSGDSSISWPFTALTDTTRRKTFLQSEPLLVSGDMQSLTLHYRARVRELQRRGTVPNLPLFRLRLVDAESGAALTVLRMANLNQLTGTQFNQEDSLLIDLQPYQGQQILLQMQTVFHVLAGPAQAAEQVNLYAFYETGALQAKLAGNSEPEAVATIPAEFALSQNYPNPFNPATTITLSLPQESRVSLEVYDVTGRKVRALVDEPLSVGVYKVIWEGRDESGEPVSSGVYIYRVVAGGFVESRKMVLLR